MGPTLISGAKVLCYINGKLYAKVTSFQWTSTTSGKELETIDMELPVEIAATRSRLGFSMSLLRQIGDGGIEGPGITAFQGQVIREKYFNVILIERTSGLVLFRSDFCKVQQQSWSITAKNLMSGQVSCSGIAWINEANS